MMHHTWYDGTAGMGFVFWQAECDNCGARGWGGYLKGQKAWLRRHRRRGCV